jgi:hypothetical protein
VWLGFVDVQLSDDQKRLLSGITLEPEDVFSFLEEMTEDGYKVSFSQDKAHSCFLAAATGQDPENPNYGYTLVGRGPSLIGAVAALAYKHRDLCDGGTWRNYNGNSETTAWG